MWGAPAGPRPGESPPSPALSTCCSACHPWIARALPYFRFWIVPLASAGPPLAGGGEGSTASEELELSTTLVRFC